MGMNGATFIHGAESVRKAGPQGALYAPSLPMGCGKEEPMKKASLIRFNIARSAGPNVPTVANKMDEPGVDKKREKRV
jgi:hypothetical protein